MIRNLLLVLFTLLASTPLLLAQNTVGLISYNPNEAFDGYNLHFPHGQGNAYLLDNCGEIVHMWEDNNFRPGNGAFLNEAGELYICKGNGAASNSTMHAGGGGEKIEIRDWDNNIKWSFTYNDETKRLHHDIAILPNGNVLAIAWEYKDSLSSIQAGRDPATMSEASLWPEHIIEVDTATSEIVWQWHVWDHLVQDFDPSKDNYGVVGDNPQLVDINFDTNGGKADWLHANAIAYNHFLDQIVISVPTFGEIWVIDHSTTTAQAAGHTGGLAGRGGDLLYRWGNPQAYRQGAAEDQKLFFQHDIHWIMGPGLDNSDPNFGKMMVFSNRAGDDYSAVHIFNPPFDSYELGYLMSGDVFLPNDFDWTYTTDPPQELYSTGLSGAQRLPNGNTLICEGRSGYSFEVAPDGDIVWEYINPLSGGNPVAQGTVLEEGLNIQFRMNRYPADFAGFDGRDLTPFGFVELEPNTEFCNQILPTQEVDAFAGVEVFPNPTSDRIHISLGDAAAQAEWLEVSNLLGESLHNSRTNGQSNISIPVEGWAAGVYILRINGGSARKVVVGR